MILAAAYPHEAAPKGAAAAMAARLQDMLPVIETARLTLRAPSIADFAAYAEIMTSERAVHMDGPMARDDAWYDFTATVAGWLLRGHGLWTVTNRADGETLGFVLLNMEPGDREPELGFFFRAGSEGQGFALEAATAARDYALDDLGLESLVSYIAPANKRSANLADRLGAIRDTVAEAQIDDDIQVWRHAPLGGDGGMEAYA